METTHGKKVLIIGAGLGGLSCAHSLLAAGVDVTVCETASRAGGVVSSIERNGFRFETGPHTVLPSALTFRTICDELGIADQLIPSSDRAKTRYLWYQGKLQPLPQHPLKLLRSPLLSARAKLHILREPLRRRAPHPEDAPEPSLGEFLTERIGEEPAQRLAGAFVRGIYAGDVNALGARSAFPRLWKMVEEHGSILRGIKHKARAAREAPPMPGPAVPRGKLLSLPEGLGGFTGALADRIGRRLRTKATVEFLTRSGSRWSAKLVGGENLHVDEVVLAVPARAARALLLPSAPPPALELLGTVPHARLTVCHLGFAPISPQDTPEGFGYLVPPTETGPEVPRVLGTIFASNLFDGRAPSGGFSVASFYRSDDVDPSDPEHTTRIAVDELSRSLGWKETPPLVAREILSWKDVIPQYTIGHNERMARLEQILSESAPGVHVAASYIGGVSVEDVLARGRSVAGRIAGASA